MHYPFENADWFEHHFPGDFIVEYIGQTRGWFYTLHVLATALFDRPAFTTCISHGIVLGNDGKKMSKSLRNYPDVREVFDRDGADAMRWFLMSSPILRGGNLVVTEQGIRDSVRQVLIPLWNSWYFFALYANAAGEGYDATLAHRLDAPAGPLHPGQAARRTSTRSTAPARRLRHRRRLRLDAQLPRRADQLVHPALAGALLGDRRRPRRDAFDTLYTVLEVVCRVAAPLLPLTTEEVWRGLTGERSVHLTDWPAADDLPADDGPGRRDGRGPRRLLGRARRCARPPTCAPGCRWPSLTVVVPDAAVAGRLRGDRAPTSSTSRRSGCSTPTRPRRRRTASQQRLTVNARAAGPRLGKDVQLAIKGSKSGDWSVADDGTVTAGGLALVEGEFTLETVAGAVRRPLGDRDAARAAASSCSTPTSRRSSRPRAWPATWSARSSRPARTPASTSPTGSRLTSSAARARCWRRRGPTRP